MTATSHRARTTSSPTEAPATDPAAAPTFARLVRTELRRLLARRFVRALGVLVVLAYVGATIGLFATHHKNSAADVAAGVASRDATVAQVLQDYQQCRAAEPADAGDHEMCGDPPTTGDFRVQDFVVNHAFEPADYEAGALGISVLAALLAFVVAATFVGAEWSSRNLIGWLFWEPRRVRLMGAKLLALAAVIIVAAAVGEALWLGIARALLSLVGRPVSSLGRAAHGYWGREILVQLRGGLLVLPAAALGFGVANLIRNTAGSFGVGFVYFAVIETAIRLGEADWQPYLFGVSVIAWTQSGGVTVRGGNHYDVRCRCIQPRLIHVSTLHGGVVLLVYAAVVLAVSLALFRRRDIT